MLKSKTARFDSLMNSFSLQHYNGSDMGDRLFGVAASMIPQAGMNGIAIVAPIIASAIWANVGVSINTSKIVDRLPGRGAISKMVIRNAVDTVMLTRENIKQNPIVFISCNKGKKG